MRSNTEGSSAGGSASSAPDLSSTAKPAPTRATTTAAPTGTAPASTEESETGPITIRPRSHGEARDMAERIKRRTGRDVVVAEGFPGLDEPVAGESSIPLTGDRAADQKAAIGHLMKDGGESLTAPK